ncbi:hypothetical protein PMNALOAF_2740 [Methylobacterium adhaesivum]|nr:hypothetical protein PMNALOAF_2740 [Methylobacterium adhaesivum]
MTPLLAAFLDALKIMGSPGALAAACEIVMRARPSKDS